MKWKLNEPKSGDIVRVQAGSVYHYGIYVSDSEVIQFGTKPQLSLIVPEDEVRVISTDVSDFLLGGFLEVGILSRREAKKRRPISETVAYAKSRLGEGGYNIIVNNCEHFAYECLFGEAISEQAEKFKNAFTTQP